jgi:hypothetical protein
MAAAIALSEAPLLYRIQWWPDAGTTFSDSDQAQWDEDTK